MIRGRGQKFCPRGHVSLEDDCDTDTLHVKVHDALEVHGQTGEQRVVAPVVGEVSDADGPDGQRTSNPQPRHLERAMTLHRQTNKTILLGHNMTDNMTDMSRTERP